MENSTHDFIISKIKEHDPIVHKSFVLKSIWDQCVSYDDIIVLKGNEYELVLSDCETYFEICSCEYVDDDDNESMDEYDLSDPFIDDADYDEAADADYVYLGDCDMPSMLYSTRSHIGSDERWNSFRSSVAYLANIVADEDDMEVDDEEVPSYEDAMDM